MSNIRTCPVCHYGQASDDPTRHVCTQVLRQRLREATAALGQAQTDLRAIAEVAEYSDPVEGARMLKQERDSALRQADAAHGRGFQAGVRVLLALLMCDARSRPFKWLAMWWQSRAFMRLDAKLRAQRVARDGSTVSESPA